MARRHGARPAGLIGGLPVVAGPILIVLAWQHGREFGEASASAAVTGMLALVAYVVAFAWLAAARVPPLGAVLGGCAAFVAVVAVLSAFHVPRGLALGVDFVVFFLALRALPALRDDASVPRPAPPAWDIPLRMAIAAAMVVALSAVSSSLGSHVSGLLAPFPIITSVLSGFTLAQYGPEAVIALLRGFLVGFYAYAVLVFAFALAL